MDVRPQFDKLSKVAVFAIGLLALCVIGYFDWATGPAFSFAIFYLIPIYFVVWFGGLGLGVLMSALCGLSLIIADLGWELNKSTYATDWDRTAKVMFFLITALLLGRLRNAYRRELELSRIDFLTGVANVREFYHLCEAERQRAIRYERVVSVAFLDLDGFKHVNDLLGHTMGDKVLEAVAKTIQSNVRATDLVARMGGDEFVVLLPEADAPSARVVLEKIRLLMTDLFAKNRWPLSTSIGMVTFLSMPDSTDEMIGAADRLMYSVKNSGKNRMAHTVYPPTAANAEQSAYRADSRMPSAGK